MRTIIRALEKMLIKLKLQKPKIVTEGARDQPKIKDRYGISWAYEELLGTYHPRLLSKDKY